MSKQRGSLDPDIRLRDEVRTLCAELRTANQPVAKRRECGKRLLDILSKERNRVRIVEVHIKQGLEKGFSLAKSRKQAHELAWGLIINSAFFSAQILASKKGKRLNPEDIKLPLKILHYSDMSQEFSQVRVECTCRLSAKQVSVVLEFCLKMLEDMDVRAVAETELMNTVVYLAERVEYVANFHPNVEVEKILLLAEGELKERGENSVAAARMFASILESCVELGVGLFLHVNRCVKMVARWCKHHSEDAEKGSRELSYLLRGVSALIRFHPEQAIKPMQRAGRLILGFAKQSYMKATAESRHAIHGYLIAHLIVNQKAGEIRGLPSGELGDLLQATITSDQLKSILSMVTQSLVNIELTLSAKKRVVWGPLDSTIRRHLECFARLLACAQRRFLIDEEWKLLDDPTTFFTQIAGERSRNKIVELYRPSLTSYPTCPQVVFAGSPWVHNVLHPLLQIKPGVNSGPHFGLPPSGDSYPQRASQDSGLSHSNSQHSMLDFLHSTTMTIDTDTRKISWLLLMISACAEAFPSGRCWVSTSHENWITLRPVEQEMGGIFEVHAGSVVDFAILVQVVANILETSGGSSGDPELQLLSLLCLIHLTKAHRAAVLLMPDSEMNQLASSWRRVWALLFRTDLRYAVHTSNASNGTCGEFVLVLLTEIVQNWCTDPGMLNSGSVADKQSTFLHRQQHQIWALPAFSKSSRCRSKQAFELISALLHRSCLSDEGRDNIHNEAPQFDEENTEDKSKGAPGRRQRLVFFCLDTLYSLEPVTSRGREMVMNVNACLAALINGKISVGNRTFLDETQNLSWVRSQQADTRSRFCVTELAGLAADEARPFLDERCCLFHVLWAPPILDPGASSLQKMRLRESIFSDCVLAEKLNLCRRIRSVDASSVHVDYVSTAVSTTLHELLRAQLSSLLKHWIAHKGGDEDDPDQVDNKKGFESSLLERCLWLKMKFGLHALVEDDKISACLEELEEIAVCTFTQVSSSLPTLCNDPDAFHSVFLDLLQILRFLTQLDSVFPISISAILRQGLTSFVGTCDSLLQNFGGERHSHEWEDMGNKSDFQCSSSSESEEEEEDKKNVYDLLDDSDDDDVVNKRSPVVRKKSPQKRKSKASRRRGSPKKKKRRNPIPPDSACACIVGSILITLEPSVSRCESVVDCLLKTNESDRDVDLTLAYNCANFMSNASVFFNDHALSKLGESSSNPLDESYRQQSPISLICGVLDSLRASAPPSSALHMFGFQLFSECARLGENDLRGVKMSMDEARLVADHIFGGGKNSLEARPFLRSDRLQAASAAFLVKSTTLESAMIEKFKVLLQNSLQDLCPFVRYFARQAVGSALRVVPNAQGLVNYVSFRLPPIDGDEGDKKQKTYREWHQHFELYTSDVAAESHVWNHVQMSMEQSTIQCFAVFPGLFPDCMLAILYRLLTIASNRLELEPECFFACEQIALTLGFENCETFLEEIGESLLWKWIDFGEALNRVPLLLSSPGLLRLLLRTGQSTSLEYGDQAPTETNMKKVLNGEKLEECGLDHFLLRHSGYLLPRLLLNVCSNQPKEGVDAFARLASDSSFQTYCSAMKDDYEKEAIKAVVRKWIHDIEAFALPMTIHDEMKIGGQEVMKLAREVLEIESENQWEDPKRGKPHLIVLRILELSGKDPSTTYPASIIHETFSEAISSFVDKLKRTNKGDKLAAAGTSLTECFLHARRWLEGATLVQQKEMRWKSLDIIFDFLLKDICQNEFNQTQLMFGTNILVDIVLDPASSRSIRSKAMETLKQIVEMVVDIVGECPTLREKFSLGSKRLIGSLMKMHEDYQHELIRLAKDKAMQKVEVLRRSAGLLRKQGVEGDAWGWDEAATSIKNSPISLEAALQDYERGGEDSVFETIEGTYDLLLKIFDNATVLCLPQECFVPCMPPYSVSQSEQDALVAKDPRLCVQKFALEFTKQNKVKDTEDFQFTEVLLSELKSHSYLIESTSPLPGVPATNDSSLNISQWMLRAALVQFEHKLRKSQIASEASHAESRMMLLRELSYLCGASCPEELRLSASRCLGELGPNVLQNVRLSPPKDEDRIQSSMETEDMLLGIQARAIEVLSEYLHSNVAINAVDTLIALFNTREGSECWNFLDRQSRERLDPVFEGKKRTIKLGNVTLTKECIASIKSRVGVGTKPEMQGTENQEWCWNAGLWQCQEGSYDRWICDLVPALIVCCYRDATNLQSTGAFFSVCQTMAFIAPRFATAIFPAIVFDLLVKSGDDVADSTQSHSGTSFKHVAEDTWIGPEKSKMKSNLSSFFQILLGESREDGIVSQDGRAIGLGLDALEILRRATQYRFQHSGSHKRNSNAMPSTPKSGKKSSKSSRSGRASKSQNEKIDGVDEKAEYNMAFKEPVPWNGVPFGTVLQLSGELVVQACIRVRRYASALFYADLYFESCFAGSGAVMEKLSADFIAASFQARTFSKTDISGYFVETKACDQTLLRDRALRSLQLLGECYMHLNEEDAYQAVERQSLDLRNSDCEVLKLENGDERSLLVPSLGELQRLDSISTIARDPVSTSMRTADAIAGLGLQNILQSYIASIEWSTVSFMSGAEKRKLREKWFESFLYGQQWDRALLDNPDAETTTQSPRKPVLLPELSREKMGFHEAIIDALRAYAHDDMQTSHGLLITARTSLFEAISSLAGLESSWEEMPMLIERMQHLNDIENLVNGRESTDELLTRWGCSKRQNQVRAPNSSAFETTFASTGFSPNLREAIFRFLRYKTSQLEPIMSDFDPQQCLVEHLWKFCRWCQHMKFLPQAESSLQRLRAALEFKGVNISTSPLSLELVLGLRLEEAHLRESRGDFATAIRLTKQAIGVLREEKKRRSDSSIDGILADAQISCGGWLGKRKIEPAEVILESYHKPGALLAKSLLDERETPENRLRCLKAQISLAQLASGLYDSIQTRVKSIEWLKSKTALAERELELKQCLNMIEEAREKLKKASKKESAQLQTEHADLVAYGRQLRSEINLAKESRIKTSNALTAYLTLAVQSFVSALVTAGVGQDIEMSSHLFRMVFLWLSTCGEGRTSTPAFSEINSIVEKNIENIPSFRFVALTSQLFAQINSKDRSKFQPTLHRLVERMCTEHPYHCLVQLISVCNGKEVGEGVGGRSADFFLENMSDSKIEAAKEIAQNLRRKGPQWIGDLLENYQILMSAYIKLANADIKKYVDNSQFKNIPLSHASNSQRLDRCLHRAQDCLPAILTKPPPLRSGCDYGDGKEDPIGGERVKGFGKNFSITESGLHRPKIIICEGTQGGSFRQLVKGEDEIRQDAVMEQVFNYVNDLFRRKDVDNAVHKSKKDLHMVTYNIIPLSPSSGVLEWVENSLTLGDYITDTKTSKGSYALGSHSRYYPGEWGNSRCRQHYASSPPEVKRETFETVCRFSSPSFRFFFVERFGYSLKEWYTAKMKYARSVAVSSFVGHILGIGDRHTNNILISQLTGEVIHIDFGIVFEQGKVLTVAEVVPFRLTRNIVDGLGPTGTEGTFTSSAEATAVLLRENSNALSTILSAIASDPLYRWSVSPVEARRRQRLTEEENEPALNKGKRKSGAQTASMPESKSDRNEAATLVIAKVLEKLAGYEDGTSGEQQGVEGQVQLLINSARDPANLSVMFQGWAPWI